MQVAIHCAGFTPGEADQLRRSMATFKFTGGVSHFRDKLIDGMIAKGYEREFAERTFSQLEGFGSYGFPESHAASFALIAYASSWMKCHHPDAFCAALLNSQPMGFYAPAQVVRDASEHGVEIRPVCVNASRWDCTLEPRKRPVPGGAAGPAHGQGPGQPACSPTGGASWRRTISQRRGESGGGPIFRRRAWSGLQRQMHSQHSGLTGGRRSGRSKGLPTAYCRCSLPADAGRRPQPELAEPVVTLVPDDGRARGGRRLPQHRPEPAPSPGLVPAHDIAVGRHDRLWRPAKYPRRQARCGARYCAGAAEARIGQGGDVHHHRGRNRHRQPDPVAGPLRAAASPGAFRPA